MNKPSLRRPHLDDAHLDAVRKPLKSRWLTRWLQVNVVLFGALLWLFGGGAGWSLGGVAAEFC
jgi:hypothetical protein